MNTMNRADIPQNNAGLDPYALIQLSSMSLDPFAVDYPTKGHLGCDDATASTNSCSSSFKSTVSSSSQLSGWGSAISRKSYACLRTLEAECRHKGTLQHNNISRAYGKYDLKPQQVQTQYVGEGWGYFVDTPDN